MKPRSLAVAAAVLLVAAVCVRLGFWQLSRRHEKQRLNRSQAAALAAAPLRLGSAAAPLDSVRDRRVELTGRFDERRQVVLAGRAHAGSPGVEVVTPLLLADGSAVLVDRGWLYAGDAATARPQQFPEPGERAVTGFARPLERGAGGAPWRRLPADLLELWSARALDPDSLAARFPYALAPWFVRELPGPGVPGRPLRTPPRKLDEFMHLSYAIQWFVFAAILLGGSLAVARARRRRGAGAPSEADPELYRSS
ncbi:MAG: SURF1 family protein [Candidatus Eisenbacteria bacterium]|nr:SURF1 family protein [Candidatus Eisenbacteria bacterium]